MGLGDGGGTYSAMTPFPYANGQTQSELTATADKATIHDVRFCHPQKYPSISWEGARCSVGRTPTRISAKTPNPIRPMPDATLYIAPKRAPVEDEYPSEIALHMRYQR